MRIIFTVVVGVVVVVVGTAADFASGMFADGDGDAVVGGGGCAIVDNIGGGKGVAKVVGSGEVATAVDVATLLLLVYRCCELS